MRGTLTLPDGYAGLCSIDLQKDKRLALLINGLALLIALPLVFLGNRIVPLRTRFSMDDGFGFYFLRLGMLTAGYAAYVVLHELVHGVCMKYFSGAPVRYGFTGLYAYAGSEAYFTKKRYFIIALAPVAVWGVVLLAPARYRIPVSEYEPNKVKKAVVGVGHAEKNQVETMVSGYDLDIKVAVMGCVVNGPGEAKEADLGVAGGIGEGLIIKHGEVFKKVPESELLGALKYELDHWGE